MGAYRYSFVIGRFRPTRMFTHEQRVVERLDRSKEIDVCGELEEEGLLDWQRVVVVDGFFCLVGGELR